MTNVTQEEREKAVLDIAGLATERRPIYVVDWDGVCTEAMWPEWGEWIPGAQDALREMLKHGEVRILSSRLNPYKFGLDGIELRSAFSTQKDIKIMRKILDDAGLEDVIIHTTHGKPTGTYYIDDRAVQYTGSWGSVLKAIGVRPQQPLDFGPEERATDPVTGGSKGRKQAVFAHVPLYAQVMKARVHGFGIFKYPDQDGAPNWTKGTPWSWMYDAAMRHIMAFWGGEALNPESGLPHLAHAAWMLDVLLEFEHKGIGTDDRPTY